MSDTVEINGDTYAIGDTVYEYQGHNVPPALRVLVAVKRDGPDLLLKVQGKGYPPHWIDSGDIVDPEDRYWEEPTPAWSKGWY